MKNLLKCENVVIDLGSKIDYYSMALIIFFKGVRMPRSFWFGSLSILLLASLLFLFVSCFEQPVSPYQPVNTKLYLSVQSSTLQFTIGQYYVDTVGDSINIGVTSNLPQFVDSVTVGIFSDAYLVEQGTILKNINASGKDPTWFKTLLNKDGKKYIIAKAFIQDGYKSFDTIIINVLPRQAATPPRNKPHITVSGLTTFAVGQVCSLSVTVNDSTVGQTHTFFAKQDTQSQFSVFTPPFMWTPPMGFTGTSTVLFKVADSDSPSYFDTQTVVMTVLAVSPINHAPKWANKTINEVGSPGNAINLTVSKMCTDPDGDLLIFSLVPGVLPSTDTITTSGDSSIYSFTPGPGDTGTFNPRVVAVDPQGLSDTMTISLKINAVVVKSYSVTYDGNGSTGGNAPSDPSTYTSGSTVTIKTNSGSLVKTGSTFTGWNTAADGTGTAYAASATFTMGSANVTLYATWTANPTYTVTYNGNGNTSGTVPTDPGAYVTGATVTTKTNSGTLVKTGSTFAGWNTAADGTGMAYAASATFTMGSANVTLYATWTANPTYTITYNGNGNTSGTVPTDPGAYVTGATVTTKTNSGTLAKTGSTFAGWNTAADGTGMAYAASATFTMGSANVTLYATWTANPTYTITYNGNGNTSGTVPTDPGAYVTGATVTTKTNSGTLAKTGSTFAGWNTAADGTGTAYAASATFTMGSANVTLYATWTANPTYTVTYNGNGNTSGTVPTDPGAYVTGATVTTKTNSGTLAKTGSTFTGWNTAADGTGTTYASSATFTMGTANVTLYATWTTNQYTVTFNSQGGSSVASENINFNAMATAPAAPTQTGYTFTGWYTDAAGTAPFFFTTPITAAITLYAKWTAISYTIIYTLNGGTNSPSNPATFTIVSSAITLANPTYAGYAFGGWYSNANFTGTAITSIPTGTSSNQTLYAQWTLIPTYTVTYNGNGSTGGTAPTDAGIYMTGATVTVVSPGTLVKTGYTFAGWNTAANGNGTSYAASATFAMSSANVVLYAKWIIITYQLTVTAGTGGTITTPNSSSVTVNYGAATSIVAAPLNSGYAFVNWTVTTGTATIANATSLSTTVLLSLGNATVTANFKAVYTITYNGNGNTSGSVPTDANYYSPGASVSVYNGSNGLGKYGYVFIGWKGGPVDTNTKTFTMPSNNVVLNAQWDIRDADGNHYDTVVINGQTWMKQNLKTTKFSNGAPIAQAPVGGYFNDSSSVSWYSSDTSIGNVYGAMYSWKAANSGQIAPSGWRVPTIDDWNFLLRSYPDTITAMNALKESGTVHWSNSNNGTNSSGFTALPGGFIISGMGHGLQEEADWWTTTQADENNGEAWTISSNINSMSGSSFSMSSAYLSIRCIRN